MTPQELRQWLLAHAEHIFSFTDYEVALSSEEDLQSILEEDWFRVESWNEPGYRFVPLGQNGTGGEVALWVRANDARPSPIVFFGPGGGTGVLAPSPDAWPKALAYGPSIVEYDSDFDANTSRLSVEANPRIGSDADPARRAAAGRGLAAYRRATIERFGALPPFDELVTVDPADRREFGAWIASVRARAEEQERK